MIVEGRKSDKPRVDWNAKFRTELKGELSDEVAHRTLGKFLMYNVGMLVQFLTGWILYPDQRLMIKGWLLKNYTMTIASRGGGKCIDEDATVLTENGFKAIKEVEVGERIWANKGLQIIEGKTINPKEKGLEVKTKMGYLCKGKIGHKIYCLNPDTFELEWKNVEDLKGNEIVPVRYGMNQWADKNPIEGFQANVAAQAHKITPKHEPDFYYLMGLIVGDGCLRGKKSTVNITSADKEVSAFLSRKIPEYIDGGSIRAYSKDQGLAQSYEFNSLAFKQLLAYLGHLEGKAHTKTIPRRLLGLNKQNMSAFLSGLFDTDGCCVSEYNEAKNGWKCCVELSSSSLELVKAVQGILLNYGIVSSLKPHHKAGWQIFSNGKEYYTHDAWRLCIRNKTHLEIFAREIGFGIKRKQDKLNVYLQNVLAKDNYHFNLLPVGNYLRAKYSTATFAAAGMKAMHNSLSVERLKDILAHDILDENDRRKFTALTEVDYYFDPIDAIVPVETVSIDIQVANESCYWSNGFINHNSWVFSHFCYIYCLFNPGKTVVMIAPTFRSSRKIIENIEKWALSKRGFLLRQCIKRQTTGLLASKKPDVWSIEFKNGARIIALPLGDAEKLRGYRCSVLGIDEGLLIPKIIIDTVLKPFLVATAEEEVRRRQIIRASEERLIAAGKMKPEESTKFGSDAKMIILSSASYSWQDLFSIYKDYLKKIYAQDDAMMKKLDEVEKKKLGEDEEAKAETIAGADFASTYLVHQFSYKLFPYDRLDSSAREEIESGMYSETAAAREFGAQFVQDSDGYFRAKAMEECTLSGGDAPCPEYTGEKGAEYILSIDPNMSGSEVNDHFAMCVTKIVTQQREGQEARRVGLVVHQYANAGAKLEHHIAYLYYLWTHFNIVYVAVDTTQGDNSDFINVCNESELFKKAKLSLNALEVDFGKETFDHLVEEIQRSYNKAENRIVQKQYFHSSFQRAANEYLQASFNRKTILFPAHITDNPGQMDRARLYKPEIVEIHPAFKSKMSLDDGKESEFGNHEDFIEHQDVMTDLVKKECALIQISSSSLGNISFDLPQHIKRNNQNRMRVRKDSYSALFLGNWAFKLYLESQERPFEQYGTFYAGWAGDH